MNISMEEKKAEAIKRMKLLGIFEPTIKQFKNEGYVSRSEPPFGAFYWVEGAELEAVREFEKSHDALVYLVIRWITNIGVLDSYLYVSDCEEEWEMDVDDLKNGEAFAFVRNCSALELSELGQIGIAKVPAAASVRRTW